MCSTRGWKEPTCKRYIFFYQEKPVQIDIPNSILSELGIQVEKDIPYSVYVLPIILNRDSDSGAITIKIKDEIFLQKNLTIDNLKLELINWSTEIKILREKIQDLESEKQKLDNNYQTSQQEVNQKDNEISEFKRKIEQLESRPNITLEEWNNYRQRPAREELEKIQGELETALNKLEKTLDKELINYTGKGKEEDWILGNGSFSSFFPNELTKSDFASILSSEISLFDNLGSRYRQQINEFGKMFDEWKKS
ncbi:MAG: hypothetical protein LBR43_03790 [Spiroplasmataceae bacterium]|nr:hypothetical protein [Spiroplasmataceae bacterium]